MTSLAEQLFSGFMTELITGMHTYKRILLTVNSN